MNYCKLIYNGINIDDELQGYTTVNIEGRHLFFREIDTKNIPGLDGNVVLNSSYPAREIIVHFLIKSKNSTQFNEILQKLNDYLNVVNDVIFKFQDEAGYIVGRVTKFQNPPFDSHQGIGKFTIHCQNPYRYGDKKTTSSKIITKFNFDIHIEKVTATVKENVNKIILKNETKGTKIILNKDFKIGEKIEITRDYIKINNEVKMNCLDFVESDFFQFKLFNNDIVSMNAVNDFIVEYKERWI